MSLICSTNLKSEQNRSCARLIASHPPEFNTASEANAQKAKWKGVGSYERRNNAHICWLERTLTRSVNPDARWPDGRNQCDEISVNFARRKHRRELFRRNLHERRYAGALANRCIPRAVRNRRTKSDPNIYLSPDVAFAFILTSRIISRSMRPMHQLLRKLLNWTLIENDRNPFQHAEPQQL